VVVGSLSGCLFLPRQAKRPGGQLAHFGDASALPRNARKSKRGVLAHFGDASPSPKPSADTSRKPRMPSLSSRQHYNDKADQNLCPRGLAAGRHGESEAERQPQVGNTQRKRCQPTSSPGRENSWRKVESEDYVWH
jgi:hypothetical protein